MLSFDHISKSLQYLSEHALASKMKKIIPLLLLLWILSLTAFHNTVFANSTTVEVDPPASTVDVPETFEVNITITNVINLTSWEFKLFFLNTVLECTQIVEGPFLKKGGSTYRVFNITNQYNSTHGRVHAAATLLGTTSVSGNGTLATITFQAIGGGYSQLDLIETKLGDEEIPPHPIPHIAIDGIVQVGAVRDIAVIDVTTSKTGCLPIPTVGEGYPVEVNATVENLGEFTETFNVTAYANSSIIGKQQVILDPTETKVLTFIWDTTGWSKGDYNISATADILLGEIDEFNNNFDDGKLRVVIPGDANGDGFVELSDFFLASQAFGSSPGDPNWNPNPDINGDRIIELTDFFIVSQHFGEHYP